MRIAIALVFLFGCGSSVAGRPECAGVACGAPGCASGSGCIYSACTLPEGACYSQCPCAGASVQCANCQTQCSVNHSECCNAYSSEFPADRCD